MDSLFLPSVTWTKYTCVDQNTFTSLLLHFNSIFVVAVDPAYVSIAYYYIDSLLLLRIATNIAHAKIEIHLKENFFFFLFFRTFIPANIDI